MNGSGGRRALVMVFALAAATPATAAAGDTTLLVPAADPPSPWAVTFAPTPADAGASRAPRLDLSTIDLFAGTTPAARQERGGSSASSGDQTTRATAFTYSDGYRLRRKIHFVASFATIPLFATQVGLGAKLWDGSYSEGTRTAHRAVAVSIGALFGVNTVTGVWNLVEARKDPNGRTKRLAHGLLMLAADAGFVATAALAPGRDGSGNRTAHRTVAVTSVALATTGYLIMLLSR